MFAHSLELEELIKETRGNDPEVLELIPAMRERFTRFRDKFFLQDRVALMSADQLIRGGDIAAVEKLLGATLGRAVSVVCVSRDIVARKSPGENHFSLPDAGHLLRVAQNRGIRKLIDRKCCDDWKSKDYHGRSLESVISSMLNKRSMQEVLDNGFGSSFTHPLLCDILALWDSYVCSILSGDRERANRKGGIIDFWRMVPLIGEDASYFGPAGTILCFTA